MCGTLLKGNQIRSIMLLHPNSGVNCLSKRTELCLHFFCTPAVTFPLRFKVFFILVRPVAPRGFAVTHFDVLSCIVRSLYRLTTLTITYNQRRVTSSDGALK